MAIFESVSSLADIDLSLVCRLCLTSNQNNVDIFAPDTNKFQGSLQDLVWKLFNFWVRPEDNLPRMICPNCYQQLCSFNTFSLLVRETQIKIQQLTNTKSVLSKKAYQDLNNSGNVLAKSDTQLNEYITVTPILHDTGPYEPYTVPISQVNDPWQFLSDDTSNFGSVDSVSICPSNQQVAAQSVEIKVEVDPASVVGVTESKENCLDSDKKHLKIKIKTKSGSTFKKIEKVEAINQIPREEEEDEIGTLELQNNDSNQSSDSEINIKSQTSLKKLKVQSKKDRKKYWTERSKQRSKLTEQLAEFYNFKCLECAEESKFPTYHQLNLHSKKFHGVKGYVICCHQKLQDKNVIKSHMLKHLSPGIFQCQECSKELANKESLENHLVKHLPEDKRPFKCAQCGRGFPSKGGLTAHEKSHLPEDERMRYVCDVCGKRFPYQTSLNSHKKYVHLNLRTVMCHICPKTFVDKASLNSHIHTHLTNERVQCADCGKWFKNQINLRAHMKTHEGLTFSCTKCSKVFSTKHRLGEHIRGHTDARPHQCAMCNKSFKVRAGLKTHMVQHTGEKPYQCPHCPRTFASSGNFSTHKKRMHGSSKSAAINNRQEFNAVSEVSLHNMDNQGNRQIFLLGS